MANRIIKHAFEIIHLLADANPIQILGIYHVKLKSIKFNS